MKKKFEVHITINYEKEIIFNNITLVYEITVGLFKENKETKQELCDYYPMSVRMPNTDIDITMHSDLTEKLKSIKVLFPDFDDFIDNNIQLSFSSKSAKQRLNDVIKHYQAK